MTIIPLSELQLCAIAKANWENPQRQLQPIPLPDGRWGLPADIVQDRKTWAEHLQLLEEIQPLDEPVEVPRDPNWFDSPSLQEKPACAAALDDFILLSHNVQERFQQTPDIQLYDIAVESLNKPEQKNKLNKVEL